MFESIWGWICENSGLLVAILALVLTWAIFYASYYGHKDRIEETISNLKLTFSTGKHEWIDNLYISRLKIMEQKLELILGKKVFSLYSFLVHQTIAIVYPILLIFFLGDLALLMVLLAVIDYFQIGEYLQKYVYQFML